MSLAFGVGPLNRRRARLFCLFGPLGMKKERRGLPAYLCLPRRCLWVLKTSVGGAAGTSAAMGKGDDADRGGKGGPQRTRKTKGGEEREGKR